MCLFLSVTLRPTWTCRLHDDRSSIKTVFGFSLRSLICYFEHIFLNAARIIADATVLSRVFFQRPSRPPQAARHLSASRNARHFVVVHWLTALTVIIALKA